MFSIHLLVLAKGEYRIDSVYKRYCFWLPWFCGLRESGLSYRLVKLLCVVLLLCFLLIISIILPVSSVLLLLANLQFCLPQFMLIAAAMVNIILLARKRCGIHKLNRIICWYGVRPMFFCVVIWGKCWYKYGLKKCDSDGIELQ